MQALLQSNAQVDAADSDGYDPACDHRSRLHGCECLWVRVAVVADDGAAWSESAAVARVDGNRRDGDGHVLVPVSTVGLALHLWSLWPSACCVEHSSRVDWMVRRASGVGAETAV